MGKQGKHLPGSVRNFIFHLHEVRKWDAEKIFAELFDSNNGGDSMVSLERLKAIIRMFDKEKRDVESREYLGCKRPHTGRPSMLSDEDKAGLMRILNANKTTRLKILTAMFSAEHYDRAEDAPSRSTIQKTITRDLGQSRKRVKLAHKDAKREAQLQFLDDISPINPFSMVTIDGVIHKAGDSHEKFGYSPVGEECVVEQIRINDKNYPVMAAASASGFFAWTIYKSGHGVTATDVKCFVEDKVKGHLPPDAFGALDNARNQSTQSVHAALNDAFHGRWRHLPAYSPELNPIEHCFHLVKNYIRIHEHDGSNPVALINEAFEHFSYRGDGALSGKHRIHLSKILYGFI
jgi:DDE superfamily endonuclease